MNVKAIQKDLESDRVSAEQKRYLRMAEDQKRS